MPAQTRTGASLYQAFAETARRRGDTVALRGEGGQGKEYTYRRMLAEVDRLSQRLRAAGVVRDGHSEVGLLAENRPEWPIVYLAILAAGGTVVPIDINLRPSEISYVIGHAKIETLFTSGRGEELIADIGHQFTWYSFDRADRRNWQLNDVDDADDGQSVEPAEVAALIYTSGTTGMPKAVQLTHRNILSNIEGIREAIEIREDDVFLSLLPLHHTFEATVGFLLPITVGAQIVYARSYKSKDVIEDIKRNQATVMCGVPLLYEKMAHSIQRGIEAAPLTKRTVVKVLKTASAVSWKAGVKIGRPLFRSLRQKAGMDSLRIFVSGGAALPPHIAAFYCYLGFRFFQGYGMTEASPVISTNRPNNIIFGSVGPPLPNLEVKIHEPNEQGIGEIIVKGESITPGYRDNPEETERLIRDGWLFTGDLGRLERGHLWITGRAKNLIISAAGKNIYPEEIEEKLIGLTDLISEVVVFGRSRKGKQGEEVCALIVPDMEHLAADYDINPDNPDNDKIRSVIGEIVKNLNDHIADYKRISSFDVQVQELEKTSTKKVKRYKYK